MSIKKRGLGRGLDALLGNAAPQVDEAAGDELKELPLDQLVPGRHQPRRQFDEAALQSLADSIRAQGVVQPVVVRSLAPQRYEIVAGERRWRASQLAGLSTIPAVIRRMEDRTAMAVALVENIQRADLNPLEEAEALRRLIDDCGLTHELAAEAVGRSRAAVSNLLRLMDLHAEVQALVRDGQISLGHAKVLLGAPLERQPSLAAQVLARELTVRQTEAMLAGVDKPKAEVLPPSSLEHELSERIGMPVKLSRNAQNQGRLVISFRDEAQLQRLLALLQ